MTRPIKFRVWVLGNDNTTPMMLGPEDLYDIDFKNQQLFLADFFRFDFSDCVLMQFTGLKDKNGKEIYEGDIIGGEMPDFYDKTIQVHGIVRWCKLEPAFGIDDGIADENGVGMQRIIHPDRARLKVLGNIYENPELLKDHD